MALGRFKMRSPYTPSSIYFRGAIGFGFGVERLGLREFPILVARRE